MEIPTNKRKGRKVLWGAGILFTVFTLLNPSYGLAWFVILFVLAVVLLEASWTSGKFGW